jgi:hypothetical protein
MPGGVPLELVSGIVPAQPGGSSLAFGWQGAEGDHYILEDRKISAGGHDECTPQA